MQHEQQRISMKYLKIITNLFKSKPAALSDPFIGGNACSVKRVNFKLVCTALCVIFILDLVISVLSRVNSFTELIDISEVIKRINDIFLMEENLLGC